MSLAAKTVQTFPSVRIPSRSGGLPVEVVIRRVGDAEPDGLLAYGYKFRPRLRP